MSRSPLKPSPQRQIPDPHKVHRLAGPQPAARHPANAQLHQVLAMAVLLSTPASGLAAELLVPEQFPSLTEAIEAANGGDVISVAPGIYREAAHLRPGLVLRSRGDDKRGETGIARAEATLIDLGGSDGPAVTMAEGAILDGFTITGVGHFNQELFDHHHSTQGEEMGLDEDRQVRRTGQAAIWIGGVTALVRNCIVRDNGTPGIVCIGEAQGHNRSEIHSNVACRNMGAGILLAEGASPLVEANRCFSNLGPGIGCSGAHGLIQKNICHNNVRAGIGISEASAPLVRANVCRDNRRAGIGIRSQDTRPVIVENHCHGNAMAGIGVRDQASPLLRKNRCHDNALAGIGIRDGASPRVIENRCFRNAEAGIGVGIGGGGFLGKNDCFENLQAGIGLRGEGEVIIEGNSIRDNHQAGIGLDSCSWGLATILGNRLEENGLVAIGVGAGWQLQASDNLLIRTGGLPPLVMISKGATADFVGNTFKGSGVAALRVEGSLRAIGNTFGCPETRLGGGPPQAAVWALPASSLKFIDNTVQGWGLAILAQDAALLARDNQIKGDGRPLLVLTDCPEAIVVGNRFLGTGTISPIQTSGATARIEDDGWGVEQAAEKAKQADPSTQ
jgi:hypothetical protein